MKQSIVLGIRDWIAILLLLGIPGLIGGMVAWHDKRWTNEPRRQRKRFL